MHCTVIPHTGELNLSTNADNSTGHVYAKFEVYKMLAKIENEKNYLGKLDGLPDSSKLAVRQQTCTIKDLWGKPTVQH